MSNYTCPKCGEANIDSPEGYVSGCKCLKSDTECLPTSKQIEESCRDMLFPELPPDQRGTLYIFTPEELKAYKEALCREQRELCAEACEDTFYYGQIINAEEP